MGPQPTKILVVDDELYIAESVRRALGAAYQVEAISDAREAVDVLKENRQGFEIVVTDHMMPDVAGAELIQRLQLRGFRGKFIVLSAYLAPEIEAIYRSIGVNHVIRKPFDLDEVRSAVKELEKSIQGVEGAGPAGKKAPGSPRL